MNCLSDQPGDRGLDVAWQIWQRRKWLAILAFSAASAGAITLTFSLPDLYEASATVLVERQEVPEALVKSSVTAELETRIQTIHEQVMSRARLTDVITRLGLYPELREKMPLDAIVERMRRHIRLDLKSVQQTFGRIGTIAFTLSYSGRDPRTVAGVANTLVDFYVEGNTKTREQQAVRTAEFLKEQLDGIKKELDTRSQRSGEFRLSHSGELPQQLEANLAALERLNTQLRLNSEYQIRAIERRDRLEEQLANAGSETQASPATGDVTMTRLAALKTELTELQRQFSDQYPDVIRVKAEIAALGQQIAERRSDQQEKAPAPADPNVRVKLALSEVNAEIGSLKAQEEFLRKDIGSYESRIESAPKRQEQLQQLSSDYEITKERYETLLKRYEEARLSESLEERRGGEQFRILDPAIPASKPAAPNRPGLLALGLMASLAFAIGLVLTAERLDTTFHNIDDVRAFVSVPVLARIRPIFTAADVRRRRHQLALMAILVLAGLAMTVAGFHYFAAGNEQIVRLMPGALQ